MEIMSLNCNYFCGAQNRSNPKISLDEKQKNRLEIQRYVSDFLHSQPGNLVILQEVPCLYHKELYQDFCHEMKNAGWRIWLPYGKGKSCTVAVTKAGSEWQQMPISKNDLSFRVKGNSLNIDGLNKYIEMYYPGRHSLHILGIHAPLESNWGAYDTKLFFNDLREYAESHKKKRCIILGDFNVHSEKSNNDYYEIFHSIRTPKTAGGIGYTDGIPDKEITYFPNQKTLDHVLCSPALNGKVEAQVIPKIKCCLSDHAVIKVIVK